MSTGTRVVFGTDDATAPRSVHYGRRFRGSHVGSFHSPARDPRLFHRPLRGRGIDCSVVVAWWSTAPWSVRGGRLLRGRCVLVGGSAGRAKARCTRPRATHGYFIDRSAVAESPGERSRNRPTQPEPSSPVVPSRFLSRSSFVQRTGRSRATRSDGQLEVQTRSLQFTVPMMR